jgi:hypothetical protein
MTTIIHGTPLSPKHLLQQLYGRSFCVSFASPYQVDGCIEMQDPEGMLLLDNGAFSHWRKGRGRIDREAFFAWANAVQDRCAVAVAVIPDVIQGNEDQNWLEAAYAIRGLSRHTERLMFVWHMDDSLDQLRRAARLFNFVAIGSCSEFDVQRNRAGYLERLRAASAVLDYVERFHQRRPWVHLMRGLAVFPEAIRFESADSSNVARNHCRTRGAPDHVAAMVERIEQPILEARNLAPRGVAHRTTNFIDERENAMTRGAKLTTLWNAMRWDRKGMVNGVEHVLVVREPFTESVPLDELTDEEIDRLLAGTKLALV